MLTKQIVKLGVNGTLAKAMKISFLRFDSDAAEEVRFNNFAIHACYEAATSNSFLIHTYRYTCTYTSYMYMYLYIYTVYTYVHVPIHIDIHVQCTCTSYIHCTIMYIHRNSFVFNVDGIL